ncbi:VTT domain-containing protein, partial [Azospirillum sp. TSO5]
MSLPLHGLIPQLLTGYGYWLIAGVVALESMGLPLPGETTLIAGSILAAASPDFRIEFVIGAAAAGAVVGDNVGFLIGRRYGYRLLVRYGSLLRLTEPRLRLGQYLFQRHGGKVVLLGRFVALLRVLTALLAGANRM